MADFCIPIKIAEKLKSAARDGVFNIEEMFQMNSAERRALFEKYVDNDMAKNINAGFEKAMVSDQQSALANWAKDVFTGKDKKTQKYKDVLAKIKELDERGMINPNNADDFLEDLVATKLGAYIKPEEAQEITRRAAVLDGLAQKRDYRGNLPVEYWQERDAVNNYVASLVPSSKASIILHTIGRGNMLLRLSSVTINIAANMVKTAFNQAEMLVAEAADSLKMKKTPTLFGSNPGKVIDYVKEEVNLFNKSGFSFSRMMEEEGGGQKILGEKRMHTQGPGAIRKMARVYDDVVFKMLQGTPDVTVAATAFGHTADILSTKMAKEKGFSGGEIKMKAAEYFDDAARVEPLTEIGKEIRLKAMQDAFQATNTHNSAYAKFALGLRQVLDNAAPDYKLGTALVPFAKTPSNAIGSAIDASGVSALSGFRDFIMKETKTSRTAWTNAVRKIVRSGLGITAALLLLNYVKKSDYTGEYSTDPKTNAIRKAKNVTPNSIIFNTPFGEKVISTDYLGPIAPALQGFIYARDYADTPENKVLSYAVGTGKSLITLPGLAEYHDAYDAIDKTDLEKGVDASSVANATGQWIANFLAARAIPGVVTDFAKITDQYERQPERGDVIGQIESKIPGLRETQPVKTTFTGQKVKTEDAITTLFAGSRIKTPISDPIVKEFERLGETNQTPTITNLDNPTGRLGELKAQIGTDEFTKARDDFRTMYADKVNQLIQTDTYQKAPEDVKKARIDKVNEGVTLKILRQYGYKRSKKEHVFAVDTQE